MWWSVAGRARLTVITCGKQPVETQQPPDWARMAELGWSECWPVTLETRAPVSPSDRKVTTPLHCTQRGFPAAAGQQRCPVFVVFHYGATQREEAHNTTITIALSGYGCVG